MAKSAKRRTTSSRPAPARKKARANRPLRSQSTSRTDSKQAHAIAMLRSTNGASIEALMKATGWQQHSIRGFLAGVVRRRLGLKLQSVKVDGCRLYRIIDDQDAAAGFNAAPQS